MNSAMIFILLALYTTVLEAMTKLANHTVCHAFLLPAHFIIGTLLVSQIQHSAGVLPLRDIYNSHRKLFCFVSICSETKKAHTNK